MQKIVVEDSDGLSTQGGFPRGIVLPRKVLNKIREVSKPQRGPTPGSVKSGKFGQLPRSPGSPPIRTHCEWEGVGPSRTNICCQPGGQTYVLGGAVTVQVFPLQENSGKIVLDPILLPCVLDVAVIVEQDRQNHWWQSNRELTSK